jgi:hypothetical protein
MKRQKFVFSPTSAKGELSYHEDYTIADLKDVFD